MNRKQLIILVVVGLLLGALALQFSKSRRDEFERREAGIGEKLLGDFPTTNLGGILIKTREGEVNLVKQDVWVVKERANYPAAFGEISELVRKLWDLKPVQSQKIGQSQWGRLELLAPDAKDAGTNTATLVELLGKDGKAIRSVLLGKKQMRDSGGQFGGYPVGRWVALPERKEDVFVVNEPFTQVEPKPESWLNKDFFKVEKLKAISLVSTNATNSWSLSRTNETADWVLADVREGENLDKNKLSSFNWAFSSPSFNDVLARDAEPVKGAFANPNVLKLETFEGFAYEVKVGTQPDSESFYLAVTASAELPKERTAPADEKPEDKEKAEKAWKEQQDKFKDKLKKEQALAPWVFKVAKWTVDSVLKDRSALMAEKKAEETKTAEAATIPSLEAGSAAPAKLPSVLTSAPPPPPLPGTPPAVVPPLLARPPEESKPAAGAEPAAEAKPAQPAEPAKEADAPKPDEPKKDASAPAQPKQEEPKA